IKLINPLKTNSYEVISGPSKLDEWIDVMNVESGWQETYVWTIKPTGEWVNGNAPINLFVQFHKDINDDLMAQFTIANPYILDEQYSSPTPTRTATSSTDQPPGSNGLPGFGVVGAVIVIMLAVRYRFGKV
ncbi:MAG: sarcinarray family MAST domain-containing protein, partial [Bacteroidales bacterium]|nr:sarcinarray family MAST domain-containing protein [Bacteroidales bacterium]